MRTRMAMSAALLMAGAAGAAAQNGMLDPQAATAYFDCVAREARALDDDRSDASSIGLAVSAACASARRQVAERSSLGRYDLQQALQEALDQRAVATATRFVLELRQAAKTRQPKPQGPTKPRSKEAI